MIIVLDTNVFYGDSGAKRPLLGAVFDGAANGDFDVIVPEVVVQELVRQYPERLRETQKALTAALDGMKRLNIAPSDPPSIGQAELIETYESDLRQRLSGAGRRIAAHPASLDRVSRWAVARRKPFKPDGSGVSDAIIWATVLELAARDSVLLVTANTRDFADKDTVDQLAPDLQSDLAAIGLRLAHVRLVASVEKLVDEVVRPLAGAETRARRLLANPDRYARLLNALVDATAYRPIPYEEFDVGVALDNPPQAVSVGIERVHLTAARESPTRELILSLEAVTDLLLDLTIYKADYYEVEDDLAHIDVIDGDLNDHYLSAQTEVQAKISWNVVTDGGARKADVQVVSIEPAEDVDILEEWLEAGARENLDEALTRQGSWDLKGFVPEGAVSPADHASVEDFHADTVDIYSIESRDRDSISCTLHVAGSGQVSWHIAAPTGADFEAMAESDPDMGMLRGVAEVPVVLTVEGWVDRDLNWLDVAVVATDVMR